MSALKLFHSYIRRRKKICPPVDLLESQYGRVMLNASDISRLLVDAFSAVSWDAPHFCSASELCWCAGWGLCVSWKCCYGSLAWTVLLLLVPNLNYLHPHLLKACSVVLSVPFYIPFVRSLEEGVLPSL